MIRSKEITFSYDSCQYFEFPDFECTDGETLLITGNSGTKKNNILSLCHFTKNI